MQTWHNQRSVCQSGLQNADESQEHDIAGRTHFDREDGSTRLALRDEPIKIPDQYRHHGRLSNFETLEAASNPVSSQQAPSSISGLNETELDISMHEPHTVETLVPDQICTCTACLDGYRYRGYREWLDAHPEMRSWIFGCRVTGCEWTTAKSLMPRYFDKIKWVLLHERSRDHYGERGDYRCREIGCKYVTKRWTDFKRHASSKHCIRPKKFTCPVVTCNYHDIGFARNDKLNSHFQNVHGGMLQPGKANKAVKPKDKDCA